MRSPVGGKEETAVSHPANAAAGSGDASDGAEAQQLLKKGPWTASEDAILLEYVRKHGEGNWNAVQKNSCLQRCGKSCRLRWANHLRPNLKKGSFSPEEEILILQLHAELGNKWARMAAQLPGRTDNEIKNYWNTRIKRRQRAGLPLYPPEIQQRAAFVNQRKGSLTLLENPTRLRNSHTSVSPSDTAMFSHATGGNYLLKNFELSPTPLPFHSSNLSMKIELPSNQFFLDSIGGDEKPLPSPPPLLQQGSNGTFDAVFPVSPRVGESFNYRPLLEQFPAANYASIAEPSQSSRCYGVDPLCKMASSDISIGFHSKKQMAEMVPPVNQDLSVLIEMIPVNTITPTTQILSDWCSSDPSPMVTDDDLTQEMQKLASTLSMGYDWGLGSCSWDNIPRIS